ELGADRAARARHQHAPAAERGLDTRVIEAYRRAPEEILDLYVPDPGLAGIAGEDVARRRHDPDRQAGLLADVDDLPDLAPAGRGDRDHELLDPEPRRDL